MATKFIDFIQNHDAVSFKEAFQEAVSEKVFSVLESKKQEVAASFFTEKKSESSERLGDPEGEHGLRHDALIHANAAASAAEHHKINYHAHLSKHAEAMAHGDHQAAHHHMEKAKMHAKAHHELVGHHINEEAENHLGIAGHQTGGFAAPHTHGKPSWHYPKAPKPGSAHDVGSKEHPNSKAHGVQIHDKHNPHHSDHAHRGVEDTGSKEHPHHKALEEMGSPEHPEAQHLKSKEVVRSKFPNTFKDTAKDVSSRVKDILTHHHKRFKHVTEMGSPEHPESQHLKEATSKDRFDKFVCVSDYQMNLYNLVLGVPYSRSIVIKNAIVIPFELIKYVFSLLYLSLYFLKRL